MSPISAIGIRYFDPEEFVNWQEMHVPFLQALDILREYVGSPIRIHESNPVPNSAHKPDSAHFIGRAVDCSCQNLPLWDFFLAATRVLQFTGIGVYPHWNSPGLHLELRDDATLRKYWWRDESGIYRGITALSLQDVFINPFDKHVDT